MCGTEPIYWRGDTDRGYHLLEGWHRTIRGVAQNYLRGGTELLEGLHRTIGGVGQNSPKAEVSWMCKVLTEVAIYWRSGTEFHIRTQIVAPSFTEIACSAWNTRLNRYSVTWGINQ